MTFLLRVTLLFGLAVVLVACGGVGAPPFQDGQGEGAAVPGQYIVTLARAGLSTLSYEDFTVATSRIASDHRAVAGRTLRLINGFVATNLDEEDVEVLRLDPRVAAVEPDRLVSVQGVQTDAIWNLDRIDQRTKPLDGTFRFGYEGVGVTVYIVDTGIRSTHLEFEGRVRPGFTLFNDGIGTEDCHSHGTHVAGTVGGASYGVAKGVDLVPVRVMDCYGSGTVSGVIAGLDWIATNRRGPSVVNMSIGGPGSNALDSAVRTLVSSGVTVVVAAGNSAADACNESPARVSDAITVGASNFDDARASYSNIGRCVDLFAPGNGVRSAWNSGDAVHGLKSGTSMATPHVAGVAAVILGQLPDVLPGVLMTHIVGAATPNVLTNVGSGSPNLLLFLDATSLPATGEPSPAPQPDPDPDPEPDPNPDPDPEPDPEPAAPAPPPCTGCDHYNDTLAGTGDVHTRPNVGGSGYVVSERSSLHQGWLRGPEGADFDLFLERQNPGGRWTTVASSTGAGSSEEVHYVGRAGTYRWRVVSAQGAGSYDLYLSLP